MERLNESAKRAKENSPGEAERSEAPPWVTQIKESRARFSGRQTRYLNDLSPAKAGSVVYRDPVPRVSLASPWATFFRPLCGLVESFSFRRHVHEKQTHGFLLLLMLILLCVPASPQQRRFDDPDDQED